MKYIVLAIFYLFIAGKTYSQEIMAVPTSSINRQLQMDTKITVEIFSDVVCPFCYIGKRRFEEALRQFARKNEVEIVWRSYQLNPDETDHPGKDVYSHLAEMKGMSTEWSKSAHANLARQAKTLGLDYNFDQAKIANTIHAHRLVQFAKTKGKGDAMEERLFRGYFTEGVLLSDYRQLAAMAEEAGLDKVEVLDMLKGDQFYKEVESDIQLASDFGVNGVPFFVIDRKYAVSGAQDPSVFLKSLQQVQKEISGRQ